jgi:hypothetical protein
MDGTRDVYRIEGARGRIELAVGNRGARILSSTCAHQTCVNMGTITRPGQHLVCIPNRITVALSGASVTDLDGITF